AYEARFAVPWRSPEGRDDLMTLRRRLAQVLPEVDPGEYPDRRAAKSALDDMFRHEKLTAEGIADEMVDWVDAQETAGGKARHLVFVVDEMGAFIADSGDKIGELNALAEMIGNKGKGKVWLVATSQQDLERVVDRTNFQPALVGRLNARFELKPHLISDEINKVVSERILKKRPAEETALRTLYQANEGRVAQLADLKSSRHLGTVDERGFIDCYPFLPHQIRLAQDIFEVLSGFRLSGGVRSMIAVIMDTLQELADESVGVVASFDQVFDAVKKDLLAQEFLGTSGVRAISESDERVPGTPVDPARVLKVLWLLQRITWVPRVPETLAKLLVRSLDEDFVPLRGQVGETLSALQEAGYVARDEATGEWKFLNERERTIEQSIQEMVRPSGPRTISMAAVRRTSQELCKTQLVTKKRLANFTVLYGRTKVPFSYGLYLDGEAVDTGSELEVCFVSPLAAGRKQLIDDYRRQNQAAGVKGRRVWWLAATPEQLENRFKRYEALVKIIGDKSFTEDPSADTQDALSEKRRERDDLRLTLVRDLERAFVNGTIFYGGQKRDLEGGPDLRPPLAETLTSLIPHVYPRFGLADRGYDFNKDVKALLNPASGELHKVAPELGLFDTQGSLQRESPLVEPVLEVIQDLEDEDVDPKGALLLDARDSRGFKGFGRAPFGWPGELVRLVLGACFRAGAIYLEQPTSAGPRPLYDYQDGLDLFTKINTFKKVTFRVAETSLSVEELKEASKALIAMGVTGIPESGNAIASAVRALGEKLNDGIADAGARARQGLPISEAVLGAAPALIEPRTAKDPTAAVSAFLAAAEAWNALAGGLTALRTFLDANRHHDFTTSRLLVELVRNHPVPEGHARAAELARALEDMDALVADKTVVERWPDYRSAYEQARGAYREVYLEAYEQVRAAVAATTEAIRAGDAYGKAPAAERDEVVDRVFGTGKVCDYPELSLNSATALLEAAARRSLTALEQALVALPGYRRQVEAELWDLAAPPDSSVGTWDWSPGDDLAGRRFEEKDEVDEAFAKITDKLKDQIDQGFTVVVK
ncbi:MAG: BREX system P-loop protein BrxC, partial [bacterium]|nr:BREX system P-loop protein BrxC [bacterium]